MYWLGARTYDRETGAVAAALADRGVDVRTAPLAATNGRPVLLVAALPDDVASNLLTPSARVDLHLLSVQSGNLTDLLDGNFDPDALAAAVRTDTLDPIHPDPDLPSAGLPSSATPPPGPVSSRPAAASLDRRR